MKLTPCFFLMDIFFSAVAYVVFVCWFAYHWISTSHLKFIIHSPICRVVDYHVDGFRFDLTSVLCRGTDGSPLNAPPLIRVNMNLYIYIITGKNATQQFYENYIYFKERCKVVEISPQERNFFLWYLRYIFHIIINVILK